MIAYKFLRPDGTSAFTGFRWPLPTDLPGPWVEAPVDPCRTGIHACRRAALPLWLGRVMYEVELAGEITEAGDKLIASRGRLLHRVDTWDQDARTGYTRMCADRAHTLALARSPALPDWDAVIEPSIAEGPALLGFVAARIAEEREGVAAYHEERARQARWLGDRLGL